MDRTTVHRIALRAFALCLLAGCALFPREPSSDAILPPCAPAWAELGLLNAGPRVLPETATLWLRRRSAEPLLILNLGGEGELQLPHHWVENYQPAAAVVGSGWRTLSGKSWEELPNWGHGLRQRFTALEDLSRLPHGTGTVDFVFTRSVPLDRTNHFGHAPSSEEVHRVLKAGGLWVHNGDVRTKHAEGWRTGVVESP